MDKLYTIFNTYYTELVKYVSWPTWEELQNNTVVVLIASLLLSIVVALMDLSFNGLLRGMYGLLQ